MAAHRIDVHHHFVPQVYKDALLALGDRCPAPGYQDTLKDWSETRSLDQMDEAGIASALVSVTTPGIHFGDDSAARHLSRQCNEAGARLASDRKNRFGLFAALPLPDVAGSLAEIEFALDQLKADGIGLYTNYEGKFLGDAAFQPVLAELDRRRAIAFVHPTSTLCCTGLQPQIPDAIIEYGTDTTRTIASLLLSGAASRYPNIEFIFCHAGGTMPFLIERLLSFGGAPHFAKAMPHGVMAELTRFHYDVAQTIHKAPIGALRAIIPNAQILFGTDYPYGIGCLGHVTTLAAMGFPASDLAAIERGNAVKLLPRFATA